MANTINRASTTYTSSNEIGYVGLPREAVLDNTLSPAEQQIFAAIASIPLIIPAALFSLAGCGSPGEAEDPILLSGGYDGPANRSPDAGTTDEGDEFVATDNGDVLVATDDGGMSGPDDGMTIADIVTDQDEISDDVAVGADTDGLAAADDGVNLPDDGMSIADIGDAQDVELDQSETADIKDVPVPTDGADTLIAKDDGAVLDLDQGETSGIEDVPVVIDSSDVLATADDGAAIAEVVIPLDVAPDGSTDQGETTNGTDVAADTAPPCTPSCVPMANTITCEEGSTNVPMNYVVKCATQFVCDGIGTAPVSVNLSDPNTQTTQSVTVDKCVNDILFGVCQVVNGDMSETCKMVTIEKKPKPGPPPTVKNPTLTNPFPSGDGCFKTGNSFSASWSATAANNNPLLCTATLKDVLTNKDVASVQVSQAPSNTMSADLPIANGNILPFRDYALAVFCQDSTGQKGSATSDAILTYYKETLLFYRFLDGAGTKVTDSGPLKLDGTMIGNMQWVVGGGVYFDGQTRVITPKSPIFKSLNEASLLITFKPTVPQINGYSVLTSIASSTKKDIWALQVAEYSYPQLLQVIDGAIATFLKSPNTITANTSYSLMGTHQSGVGTNLKQWDGSKWQTIGSKQDYLGPFVSGDSGDVLIGSWNDGSYGYVGEISKVIIIGKDIDNCN